MERPVFVLRIAACSIVCLALAANHPATASSLAYEGPEAVDGPGTVAKLRQLGRFVTQRENRV